MMTVRDAIHALEQMPEWHLIHVMGDTGWEPVEQITENINVGGVVIR